MKRILHDSNLKTKDPNDKNTETDASEYKLSDMNLQESSTSIKENWLWRFWNAHKTVDIWCDTRKH